MFSNVASFSATSKLQVLLTRQAADVLLIHVFLEGTDADLFLTVYPNMGFAAVEDSDILSLALQLRTYQGANRTVWLRWAPEFAGNWMVYGLQPTAFLELWTRMYNIIKAEAPDTVSDPFVVFDPKLIAA